MARITDPDKIENIKKATMDLIVERGYGGASISSIAKKAGVSAGYLYRHYEGKEDLIDYLICTNFSKLFNIIENIKAEKATVKEIIGNLIEELFNMCIFKPISAKFLCALLFGFGFKQDEMLKREKRVETLVGKILEAGTRTGEINSKVTEEELSCVLFSVPFIYMRNNLNKENYKEYFNIKKANRITELCINALK